MAVAVAVAVAVAAAVAAPVAVAVAVAVAAGRTMPRTTDGPTWPPRPSGLPSVNRTGALMNSGDEAWFVNGLTEVPTLGSLLPATVVDLLSDPDVTLRVAWSDSVTGAIRTGPDGLPALRRSRSTGPVQGRHLPVPRVCPACEANSARPRHSRPAGPTEAANLMCSARRTTGSSTMAAGAWS